MTAWKPEYGRAYRERKRLGLASTYIATLPWAARFERKVDKNGPNGCWLWHGAKDPRGYGIASAGSGRSTTAHRDAYRQLVGPIPEGLEVDHVCRVRACVNPAHLWLLTHSENSRLASHWWGSSPVCVNGHPFTPENTLRRLDHPGRACRICGRARAAAYRARKRAAA